MEWSLSFGIYHPRFSSPPAARHWHVVWSLFFATRLSLFPPMNNRFVYVLTPALFGFASSAPERRTPPLSPAPTPHSCPSFQPPYTPTPRFPFAPPRSEPRTPPGINHPPPHTHRCRGHPPFPGAVFFLGGFGAGGEPRVPFLLSGGVACVQAI